jgi:hypothetical protein
MIDFKTFKIFESGDFDENRNIVIVGNKSGECLFLNMQQFNQFNDAGILSYNMMIKSFMYDDAEYDNLIYYLKQNNQYYKIRDFLKYIGVNKYTIYKDNTVDVFENVKIKIKNLKQLPLRFNYVDGDFDCSNSDLTSLVGCPDEVTGSFICNSNILQDLKNGPLTVGKDYIVKQNDLKKLTGAPKKINGDFDCSYNGLKDLIDGPIVVKGDYFCDGCLLKTLEGAAKDVGGDFNCSLNLLTDLLGAPQFISGIFNCSFNNLMSLLGGPKKAMHFKCNNNELTSLQFAPIDYKKITCDNNKIKNK